MLSITAPLLLRKQDITDRYHQHKEAFLRPEDEVNDGTFNSHLPLLIINTNDIEIPGNIQDDPNNPGFLLRDEFDRAIYTLSEEGEATIRAKIDVIDHEKTLNRPDDSPEFSSEIDIRIRGNSSRHFDKKNYFMRLVDEMGENNPLPLLGMSSHHEWALHGPFLDKTMLRNYMCYNIAGEIMDYAPNVRFCELFLNGEYKGIYVLTEMITAGKDGSRLNLEVSRKHNTFSGYLLRLDRGSRDPISDINTFSMYSYRQENKLEIKYPGRENLTPEMAEKICKDFSAFEKAIYSYDYDDEKYGYSSYIDVTNFVDYLLINEITCNYDAGWLSTYMYKALDGKYRMVVWDFNNACDNFAERSMNREDFEFTHSPWYVMLMRDEAFTKRVIDRYKVLRKSYLSDSYIQQYIDDVVAYLGPAIDRNFEVWGYTFDSFRSQLYPEDRNPKSYASAVYELKTFFYDRGIWMDENIDALAQFSNASKIKKYNEKAN